MKIAWAEQAVDDLEAIRDYIARDSDHYARRFVERILAATRKLTRFPKIGRAIPEAADQEDVRELLFEAYRIL